PPLSVLFALHAVVPLHLLFFPTRRPSDPGTQLSSVHTFPSSQLGGAPPTQLPPAHVSFVVQALLSLQGAVLFVCAQPVAGTQLSAVHTFPPSHWHGAPSTQLSPAHMSFVV